MCPPAQPSCSVAGAQATADAVAVTKRVRKLEAAFGTGYEPITDDYVEMFCRNAQYIRAYKYAGCFPECSRAGAPSASPCIVGL